MIAVPYFKRHGSWLEPAIIKQADVVAANSAYLRDYSLQYNPQSFNIGQGCVLARVPGRGRPRPAPDLAPVPHPRLGFTGYLTALRLDLDLLLSIARQRPDWSLVLIGPQDGAFRRSPLHQLPNVFFLGTKPPQLAAYLHHCDVCLNPQLLNDITIGNYPLKIDEYLAMGRPVVATRTRTMELFADHVYLAHGTQRWLEALQRALLHKGPSLASDRIAFAKSHTWEACAQALCNALATASPTLV
ncbi:MAG: glycosyltransferase [Hymenobacter sp.]